ncbi:MAG: hypothetical protein LBV65_04260 [Desulfovibrio sp.]|nr:hypothetical protein [Desulfovibrio sp.]
MDDALAAKLERRFHKALQTRITVKIIDYVGLPRTFSKSKRVLDKR